MANNFKVWVDSPTAGQQVQSSAVFATDTQRINGFVAGDPASAIRVNSALRQANLIAVGLMALCDKYAPLSSNLTLTSSVTDISNAVENLFDYYKLLAERYTDSLGDSTSDNVKSLQEQINTNKQNIATNTTNINNANSKITANTNLINSNKTNTDKAINDVNARVNVSNNNITNNTNSINALGTRVGTAETNINTNKSNIASNLTKINANTNSINAVSGRVSTTETNINTINTKLNPMVDVYRVSISPASWSGSAGNWTFSVAKTTHNRGTRPIVKTFTADNVEIFSDVSLVNGNVTVRSNANIAIALHIYWGN